MGGSFDRKLGRYGYNCGGEKITKALNDVFQNKNSNEFKEAQLHNHFDIVQQNDPNNWKDLLTAYGQAGVKVKGAEFNVWCQYLQDLGTGPNGSPKNIWDIAQTRMKALNSDKGYKTKTHGTDHKVKIDDTAAEIDSPCPPPPP
jgi:hypothetical protein